MNKNSLGDWIDDLVVVGKITEIANHPNAERLSLVDLDLGKDTTRVVCGASNFKVGDIVPVVLPGGQVKTPQGSFFTVGKATIRGVESNGMMCSSLELGLDDNHDEIYLLSPKLKNKLGTPLRKALS
jgi:phenylalanyl-tRNA synthetase beta chain